ncbi:competence type IV pilus minor pilin ComGG [Streptococcus oricebi]|uniref:Competence protein ComGG n=1 Tax=Streptococcus oricebi TaxID=1547447 RepID=A0ABS5B453_9STRE|nr:competence type IV pilus minor pilin ComGG [Streptococcus oricebi]MBP2623605.1 competence protein ComGG [Streptococcus oricebi]
MVWRKKIEAGVLLYALLMAAIFSLLLQFYLKRQINYQASVLRQEERLKAYAMALLTKEAARENSGQVDFVQGKSSYQREGEKLLIKVEQGDKSYQFNFYLNSKKD